MLAELEAVSDGEMAEDMVWIRPAAGGRFPALHAGQEVLVRLDGDAMQCVGSVLDPGGGARVLIMVDRVPITEQVYLLDEDPRSTAAPPPVDPSAAG